MKNKITAEFLGTAFLVMIVLGSGVMGQNLFPQQNGLALLANSIATGAGLFVLIKCLGPISGAHMNPVVSFISVCRGQLLKHEAIFYIFAQMAGAYLGVLITHLMFDLPTFVISTVERAGSNLLVSEIIATFGLISVIILSVKKNEAFAQVTVPAYILSAYWFTSSTSFSNPAVTFARCFTNSFGGMSYIHFLPFMICQFLGGIGAWLLLDKFSASKD